MKKLTLSVAVSAMLLSGGTLSATTLQEAVNDLLSANPQIEAIKQNNKAFKTYIDEANGNYKPTIDLEVTAERKRTETKPDSTNVWTRNTQDGSNAQLNLEQMLYDGGYTPALVEETEYRFQYNELSNNAKVNEVVLDGVKSYLDLVKYDQRLRLTQANVTTHEEYLITAKENEEISGDALNTYEVQAQLHLAKKNLIDEKDNQQIAQNSFKRLVGKEITGNVCSPNIDEGIIPDSVETLVKDALTKNNTVLAQMAKIQEQRAIISQEKSKFMPTLTFNLNATHDNNLIAADTNKEIYSANIVMNYNFYSGGKDATSSDREKLFLKESQKILDSKSDLVVDEITSAYNTFLHSKDKIEELRGYVDANKNLLAIYKDQFSAGTKTFVDVLDVESDLYNAKVQLIDEEMKLLETYFTMQYLNSNIQESIVSQANVPCKAPAEEAQEKQSDKETDNLKELQETFK